MAETPSVAEERRRFHERQDERRNGNGLVVRAVPDEHKGLKDRLRELLQVEPDIPCNDARRRLGADMHHKTFESDFYRPVYREMFSRDPTALRVAVPAVRPKPPAVAAAPNGGPAKIEYRSPKGGFSAAPTHGGQWRVTLEVVVDRGTAVNLAGQAWRLLFPEADHG